MSKTTKNIKTMELNLWAKTDLFVCPLFLIVMFIFFSGWENMLGFKTFTRGRAGELHSAVLERFERVKNSADKNASPDYTDIFYEALSGYSDRLKISDKPFCDDGVKSNKSILSEIIKERNASRRREVESTDAGNK